MQIEKLFNLSGKKALVTGCSRGIGEAMAVALAEAGADIVGVSGSLKPGSNAENSILAREFGKKMIESKYGKIIFTCSLLSFQGGINVPGYTAAKSAIAGLVKALANEWASKGVHVNGIAPGYIATDNTKALRNDQNRNAAILDRIPAGRWGTPDDFKGPIVFLSSAASDYVDGEILTVDGGWMGR